MATNPPIQIGELVDVPAPGSGVASHWAQSVTNRVVQRFATIAARTAAWGAPSPAPAKGTPSYLATGDATEGPEYFNGVAWRRPWNMPWGVVASIADNGQVTTSAGVETVFMATSSFNAPGNRRYRLIADLTGGGTIAGDIFRFTMRRGSVAGVTARIGPAYTVPTPAVPLTPVVVIGYDTPPANAALSYILGCTRVQGTGTFSQWTATNYQNTMYVEDIGPATGTPT